jgi:uncharacterized phage protein (TIGR01671 family)
MIGEIKFRAWDNVKNKMYFLGESDEVVFAFESNGIVATDITEHDWGFKILEHLKYMQSTGLKDKNSNEIFEGDIVEFTWFDYVGSDTQFKGLVKYRSGLYEIWKNDKTEFFGSDGPFILNHVWLQDEEFEVIGNIYENPELLKGGETACK